MCTGFAGSFVGCSASWHRSISETAVATPLALQRLRYSPNTGCPLLCASSCVFGFFEGGTAYFIAPDARLLPVCALVSHSLLPLRSVPVEPLSLLLLVPRLLALSLFFSAPALPPADLFSSCPYLWNLHVWCSTITLLT